MMAKRVACEDPEGLLDYWLRAREQNRARPEADDVASWKRQCAVRDQQSLVIVLRLLDRVEESRVEAVAAADAAVEYLLGCWRSNTKVGEELRDTAWWRMGSWDQEFLAGMACALATGHNDAAQQLAIYPGVDLVTGTKRRRSLAAFCLFSAQIVKGGRPAADPSLCDTIIKAGTVMRKVLGEVCTAFVNDGPARAAELLPRHFATRIAQRNASSLDDLINLEGSILYHLLRREGHEPPLSDRERDYLLAYPSRD